MKATATCEVLSPGVSIPDTVSKQLRSLVMTRNPVEPVGAAITRRGVVPMNALQRLIKSRMNELGLTYREVSEKGGLPLSTIHALANKDEHKTPPRRDTLEKLAKGLRVPVDVVRVAASDAAGYHLEELTVHEGTSLEAAGRLRIVAATFEKLDDEKQQTIVAIAQMLLDQMEQRRDD